MVKDDEVSKLKNMDEFLKINLVNFWFESIRMYVKGDWFGCFMAFKSIFSMIEPYSFSSKAYTSELIQVLNEYFNSLGGKAVNQRAEMLLFERKATFKELLERLRASLPVAFVDLDLWFKSVSETNDLDVKLSNDNFGDDLSLVEKKRLALLKLDKKALLKLFSINAVHGAYARGLNENVL